MRLSVQRVIVTIALGVLSSTSSCTKPKKILSKGHLTSGLSADLGDVQATESRIYKQIINHNVGGATFDQRYYANSSYANGKNAPVFFYICPEAECEIAEMNIIFKPLAKKFRGHMLALEHRYYGKSYPMPIETIESAKYLTVDQAVADLGTFVGEIKTRELSGPWIAMGGSYAGNLAAYLRASYPHLIHGALASSAPVMPKAEFYEFGEYIPHVLGERCAEGTREFVASWDNRIAKGKESADQLLTELGILRNYRSPTNMMAAVASEIEYMTQYHMPNVQEKYCAAAESEDPVRSLFTYYKDVLQPPPDPTGNAAKEIHTSTKNPRPGLELSEAGNNSEFHWDSWYYQSCTEYGYFFITDTSKIKPMLSKLLTVQYAIHECNTFFDSEVVLNQDRVKARFHELNDSTTTRIYFTNGSRDPWSTLSFTKQDKEFEKREIFTDVIQGGAHCDDLRPSTDINVKNAQARFEALVELWIK